MSEENDTLQLFAYTDGSQRHDRYTAGGACLYCDTNYENQELISTQTLIPDIEQNSGAGCEFVACHLALKNLREKETCKIFTDNYLVYRFITGDADYRTSMIEKTKSEVLKTIMTEIDECLEKGKMLGAENISHNQPLNLEEYIITTRVHNEAANQSGARSHKPIPTKMPLEISLSTYKNDNSTGLEIIDLDEPNEDLHSGPMPVFR